MRFSLISPTFDRPEEVQEFILSVSKINYSQDFFEVILADGTPGDTLRPIIEHESKKCNLPIRVIHEEYLPVSDARNAAAEIA
ncbi:MAG: glycosyltransferase, partial [Schleiferiaceae bacterium]|nr:glycosyltransferase [Schleiferiaceae bacterium]